MAKCLDYFVFQLANFNCQIYLTSKWEIFYSFIVHFKYFFINKIVGWVRDPTPLM